MKKQVNQAFNTGQRHQNAVATWARKRLADGGGKSFDDKTDNDKPDQVGCLFADGVGLGKTWEALATTALLLDKHQKNKENTNTRRQPAHVLILVPPGLVAKWSNELRNPDGFQRKLERWAKQSSRKFIKDTFSPEESCFVLRKKNDLNGLPPGARKKGAYVLPAGVYVCNWNVLLSKGGHGNDSVGKLKSQSWDVVLADEAHHKEARNALDKLKSAKHRLLLTATPFQLDMTELHKLTKHLITSGTNRYQVLKHGAVKEFVKAVDAAFDGKSDPSPAMRENAEAVLKQLVARSNLGRQKRHYHLIDGSGDAQQITSPSEIDEKSIGDVYSKAIQADESFHKYYLERRLEIAMPTKNGARRKHVSIELQKLLSMVKDNAPAPKLDALKKWARKQFRDDLSETLSDGIPRKILVFSRLKTDVVKPIADALQQEFIAAYSDLSETQEWKEARNNASSALKEIFSLIKSEGGDKKYEAWLATFETTIRGTPFFDLLGKQKFANRVKKELIELVGTNSKAEELNGPNNAWHVHQLRIKRNLAKAVLDAISQAPLSATFSGDDTRRKRDAIAEAFKTALAPWILVATNVGSEGIDLHKYSRHLVHFDLEWNPGRLEQREGRIDRLGRELHEPARIYYLLIKDTYDERIFHQVIARARWHGVLLGRKALQLDRDDEDEIDARLVSRSAIQNLSLNLDPSDG